MHFVVCMNEHNNRSLEAKVSLDLLRRLVCDAVLKHDYLEATRLAGACRVVEARFAAAYRAELGVG